MQSGVLQERGAITVHTAVQGGEMDTEPPEARHCCSKAHCHAPAKKAKLLSRMDGDTNTVGQGSCRGFNLHSAFSFWSSTVKDNY